MEQGSTATPFSDRVSSIELLPLETDETHLLGNNVEVCLLRDGYILYDRRNVKVYRYSGEGRFLNEIGKRGNGPGEYLHLRNVQVINDEVHIFSPPDKELVFSDDGKMLEQKAKVPVGFGIYRMGSGYLTYYGYSGQRDHRVVFSRGQSGQEKGFLDLDAKVLPLDLENELFCPLSEGSVSIIDSYSPTIFIYDGESVSPYLSFDFGKYAIKNNFYEADDAFKAAEYLMSSDYAVISRYMEGANCKLVQFNLFDQKTGTGEGRYGLFCGGEWVWFSLAGCGMDNPAPFRLFDAEELIGVLSPEDTLLLLDLLSEETIVSGDYSGLDQSDNYVIAKIHLR